MTGAGTFDPDEFGILGVEAESIFDDIADTVAPPPLAVISPTVLGGAGGEGALMPLHTFGDDRQPVEKILAEMGGERKGGPTPYGWHTHAASFRCPREAALDAKEGGGVESHAIDVGGVIHELLAIYYEGRRTGAQDWRAEGERLLTAVREGGHSEVAEECARYWTNYLIRYGTYDDYLERYEVVAVEQLLERTFPWGEPYTARADLVLKGADGYVIVDHKSTGRRDISAWLEGFVIEPELLGLIWCSRKYRPIAGYAINGIVRHKDAVKQLAHGYERIFFRVAPKLIRDWLRMMRWKYAVQPMLAMVGDVPSFELCNRRYGRCRYFERCVYGGR